MSVDFQSLVPGGAHWSSMDRRVFADAEEGFTQGAKKTAEALQTIEVKQKENRTGSYGQQAQAAIPSSGKAGGTVDATNGPDKVVDNKKAKEGGK